MSICDNCIRGAIAAHILLGQLRSSPLCAQAGSDGDGAAAMMAATVSSRLR
jgi:hypothetical protein